LSFHVWGFWLGLLCCRTTYKEIGVRKVLGASLFNLWNLLSKDFVALVFISFLIAMPLAYFSCKAGCRIMYIGQIYTGGHLRVLGLLHF
jgi:hypothetical protein